MKYGIFSLVFCSALLGYSANALACAARPTELSYAGKAIFPKMKALADYRQVTIVSGKTSYVINYDHDKKQWCASGVAAKPVCKKKGEVKLGTLTLFPEDLGDGAAVLREDPRGANALNLRSNLGPKTDNGQIQKMIVEVVRKQPMGTAGRFTAQQDITRLSRGTSKDLDLETKADLSTGNKRRAGGCRSKVEKDDSADTGGADDNETGVGAAE